MDKPINEHIILIYGKACVRKAPKTAENGDVTLLVRGGLRKVEDVDNDDGTMDRVYKIKQIDVEICLPKNQ